MQLALSLKVSLRLFRRIIFEIIAQYIVIILFVWTINLLWILGKIINPTTFVCVISSI